MMFSATAFLDHLFPEPGDVAALLTKAGAPAPSAAAVKKWRQRNSIPGDALASVLTALELETGHIPSLVPYMGSSLCHSALDLKDKHKPTGALLATFG